MYAVFFDYDNTTYRLPVNPEEIKITSSQSVEKYTVLGLGQIVAPSGMELKEYSFECEIPKEAYSYVEIKQDYTTAEHYKAEADNFNPAEQYLKEFQKWRTKLVPIRFIAGRGASKDEVYEDSINTLVLIQDITVTEKAGEEGDKYVSFQLIEYKKFYKRPAKEIEPETGKKLDTKEDAKNPKSKGTYVVQSGDSLWAIAKKQYGDGAKYTKIYNANKDKIKNPSLIYPGQKLVIP
jgi:nucleoid-associated protein YgaU